MSAANDTKEDGKNGISSPPKSEVRRRWSLLARMFKERQLSKKDLAIVSDQSAIVFESYHLIKTETSQEDDGECCWKRHYLVINNETISAQVRHLTGSILFEELLKFNNTGNVCVWPAEEVLAYYVMKHLSKFQGKRVVELGGGMTCLAGLMLGCACECAKIMLTDGSEDSVSNLDKSIERNRSSLRTADLCSRVLRWDHFEEQHSDLKESFDFVLSADCLFFDEFRVDLTKTIAAILAPGGEAIIMAPKRGHSLDDFVSICRGEQFGHTFASVEVDTHFDDHVYRLCEHYLKNSSNYSPVRHQQILITLKKSHVNSSCS